MRMPTAIVLLLAAVLAGCEKPTPAVEVSAPAAKALPEAPPIAIGPSDWPWWRGPDQSGHSAADVPAHWSPTQNILWKAEVPGIGHSSPTVCGEQILLTTADEQKQTQSLLAFDRGTGERLWSTVAHAGGLMPKHQKNSHASATRACDGRHVYAAFINDGGLHVTATDLEGRIIWRTKTGSFKSEHGYGSAPVLYQSLLIVNGDSLDGGFVAALHRGTGQIVWRIARESTGRHGSYATPVVAELGGRPQLLLTGFNRTMSYDPATGEVLWSAAGPAEVTGNTPAMSDRLVFTSGGYPEKELLAIRADGRGDVTDSHIVWRATRGVTYVPSPLYHDGLLFVINDNGIATCFEAETGKQVWRERLAGSFTASPILAGGRLYVTNEAGTTFVLRAGHEFEVLAENDLGERTLASPAVSDQKLFLRTERHLYCISGTDEA